MNLLLCKDAESSQIVLCTYTEKAAFELQDRLASIANHVGYKGDLSQIKVGTIHSICQQLINENLHHTPLGNNYETLDHFTQQLLIFEHLDKICPDNTHAFFRERWSTPWHIAKKLKFYFDTIAEELIFDKLKAAFPNLRRYPAEKDTFLCYLTHAYYNYQHVLVRRNSIDFAHLQKCAYNLLTQQDIFQRITKNIRYVCQVPEKLVLPHLACLTTLQIEGPVDAITQSCHDRTSSP
jgi:DNA helicase-2/ATP-dependent DNA helicase PcrA